MLKTAPTVINAGSVQKYQIKAYTLIKLCSLCFLHMYT